MPGLSPGPRWALTPPFHPCLIPGLAAGAIGGLFSVACPWGCPRWALPTSLPCGGRTFLRAGFRLPGSRLACLAKYQRARSAPPRVSPSRNASRRKNSRRTGGKSDPSAQMHVAQILSIFFALYHPHFQGQFLLPEKVRLFATLTTISGKATMKVC
jgi:hypothetical protein